MFIVLGGFTGSGKQRIAREYARLSGLHLYLVHSKRRRRLFRRDTLYVERMLPVRSDDERMQMFGKIVEELPMLSKLYDGVVLSATFHRAAARELLLREARRYFQNVRFVWIESTDDALRARMNAMGQSDHIDEILQLKQAQHAEWEPESDAVLLEHTDSTEDTIVQLRKLLD